MEFICAILPPLSFLQLISSFAEIADRRPDLEAMDLALLSDKSATLPQSRFGATGKPRPYSPEWRWRQQNHSEV
jgi:hypothetical protein